MIDVTQPLEWEDGTPVPSYMVIARDQFDSKKSVLIQEGCDWDQRRPTGYYNVSDGGYAGSESLYQRVRNVGPREPEAYEGWFV